MVLASRRSFPYRREERHSFFFFKPLCLERGEMKSRAYLRTADPSNRTNDLCGQNGSRNLPRERNPLTVDPSALVYGSSGPFCNTLYIEMLSCRTNGMQIAGLEADVVAPGCALMRRTSEPDTASTLFVVHYISIALRLGHTRLYCGFVNVNGSRIYKRLENA